MSFVSTLYMEIEKERNERLLIFCLLGRVVEFENGQEFRCGGNTNRFALVVLM